jgi:hypothetical protein
MSGLKHLRVDMMIWAPGVEFAYGEVLFTPLEAVKGMKEFEVWVSWEKDELLDIQSGGKVWPFTLTRGMVNMD